MNSPTELETISNASELLRVLGEHAAGRAVVYLGDVLAVCDCAEGDAAHPIGPIAWIANTGSARELLTQAYEADLAEDVPAWSALPLRYGPYCSTWVLSDHPNAPTKPGPDE